MFSNKRLFPLLFSILILFASSISQIPAQTPTGKIIVEVKGFENNNGKARLLLFSSNEKKYFPKDKDKALRKNVVPIESNQVVFVYENLPYGDYAISVHHDEDENGKVNTNFLKIPKEGLGASNDAKGFMGPPSFDKAKVSLNKEEISITINLVN
jgi:uncharacterized protein (DUF2141 family)